MQKRLLRHVTVALLFAAAPALAQLTPQGEAKQAASPAPAAGAEGGKTFSQQDLDTILAPIALYPDALLAQILMAATYPLEIVEADRWAKANPGVKGQGAPGCDGEADLGPEREGAHVGPEGAGADEREARLDAEAGRRVPCRPEGHHGDRAGAARKGRGVGQPQVVARDVREDRAGRRQDGLCDRVGQAETVYVPTYNPATVYGSWWYPYPPYSMYPPGYAYAPGLAFATGVFVGAAIWGNANWGGNNVNVNVNKYNNFNKTNIQNSNFQHNAANRKGVAYKDQGVANKYNRGTSAQTSQARSQYQGRSEGAGGGRSEGFGGGDRGSAGASQRGGGGGASQMGASSRGGGGGGFQGAGGGGASTRQASARGGASRGGGGGGRGGGRR
jgi:hypothetical protein